MEISFLSSCCRETGTPKALVMPGLLVLPKNIVAGVWFGVDDYSVSLGENQAGSVAALPAWATFMKSSHEALQIDRNPFEVPSQIIKRNVCSMSKNKPLSGCSVETEIFILGTEPTRPCKIHKRS